MPRQTGRTTRLLMKAIELAIEHKSVTICVDTEANKNQIFNQLCKLIDEHHPNLQYNLIKLIRIIIPNQCPIEFNELCKLSAVNEKLFAINGSLYLIDHAIIERYYGSIFRKLAQQGHVISFNVS